MSILAKTRGRIVSLQRSAGGVPKLPVERAIVLLTGMEGDWQRNREHHGGPDRALCVYAQELLDCLVAEGHPAVAGAMGENVTLAGVQWPLLQPGTRLRMGALEVQVTTFAAPCWKIASAFRDGAFTRVSEKLHPGWSRVYVRVLRAGQIVVGDEVEIVP